MIVICPIVSYSAVIVSLSWALNLLHVTLMSAGALSLHGQAQTAPLRPEAQGEQSSGSLVGASKAVFSF